MSLNEEQQLELKKVRDALDNIYDRLNIELYEKVKAAKVSYKKVNPSEYITDNLQYIVEKLSNLQEQLCQIITHKTDMILQALEVNMKTSLR